MTANLRRAAAKARRAQALATYGRRGHVLIQPTSRPSERRVPSTPKPMPPGDDPRGGHLIHPLNGTAAGHRVGWRCLGMDPITGHCALSPRWWNLWGAFWGRTR